MDTLPAPWLTIPFPILLIFFVLNIFLAVTATLGNSLILTALHKVSSVHPPTKLLLRCLAVTDLCVGLVVQPLYFVAMMIISSASWPIVYRVGTSLSYIFCDVSLITITASSVDRVLALLLGLRYRHTVTFKRMSENRWILGPDW